MLPILCPFCGKSSPPDAKFCSACGGALHLAPCPKCGAVNDVTASTCYQCRAALAGLGDEGSGTPVPAPPEAPVAAPPRRRRAPIIAGAAALAVIGGLGYYAYLQRSPTEPPAAPATAVGPSGRIEAEPVASPLP